jgi:hypothetical protein
MTGKEPPLPPPRRVARPGALPAIRIPACNRHPTASPRGQRRTRDVPAAAIPTSLPSGFALRRTLLRRGKTEDLPDRGENSACMPFLSQIARADCGRRLVKCDSRSCSRLRNPPRDSTAPGRTANN